MEYSTDLTFTCIIKDLDTRSLDQHKKYDQPKSKEETTADDLSKQYEVLCAMSRNPSVQNLLVSDPELRKLNRYKTIQAFGHSMALCKPHPIDAKSYVNANFVTFPGFSKNDGVFIASQAPPLKIISNFINLLLKESVPLILTIVQEKEIPLKCENYWSQPNQKLYFEDFVVECQSLNKQPNHDKRTLKITDSVSHKEHLLEHFHVHSWVDQSAPSPKLIEFLIQTFEYIMKLQEEKKKPVLVHCSAGVGRTGTFICAYYLYRQWLSSIQANTPFKFSIFNVVKVVRMQRHMAVYTEGQYKFLFDFATILAKKKKM